MYSGNILRQTKVQCIYSSCNLLSFENVGSLDAEFSGQEGVVHGGGIPQRVAARLVLLVIT